MDSKPSRGEAVSWVAVSSVASLFGRTQMSKARHEQQVARKLRSYKWRNRPASNEDDWSEMHGSIDVEIAIADARAAGRLPPC